MKFRAKKNRAVTRLHRTGSRAIRRRAIRGIRRAIRRIGVSAIRLRFTSRRASRGIRDFRGFTRRPVASRRRRARPRRNDARRLAFAPRARVEPTTHRKMTSDSARRRERPRRIAWRARRSRRRSKQSRRPRRNRRVFFRDSPPRNVARRITHPPSRKNFVGRSLSFDRRARTPRRLRRFAREWSPPNARRRSETRDWRRRTDARPSRSRRRRQPQGRTSRNEGTVRRRERSPPGSSPPVAPRSRAWNTRVESEEANRRRSRGGRMRMMATCSRRVRVWSQVILFWWIKMVCYYIRNNT